MPHKMITDRQKVDEALVAAIHRHRDNVLAGLVERLEPFLPEGTDASGFAVFYDAKLALRSTLIELRRAAVVLLGEEPGEALVKIDQTPRLDPKRILEQGELTLEQLRTPGLQPPESIVPGQPSLDIAAWAARLEPEVAELRDALAGVVTDRQDIAALVALKTQARRDSGRDSPGAC